MGARCEGGSTLALEPSCLGEGGGEAGREMAGKAAPKHHVPASRSLAGDSGPWGQLMPGPGRQRGREGAVASEVGSL